MQQTISDNKPIRENGFPIKKSIKTNPPQYPNAWLSNKVKNFTRSERIEDKGQATDVDPMKYPWPNKALKMNKRKYLRKKAERENVRLLFANFEPKQDFDLGTQQVPNISFFVRNEKWVPETRINYSFILILKFILILHLVKELFRYFIFYGLSWSFWDSHNFFIYIETRFCKIFLLI